MNRRTMLKGVGALPFALSAPTVLRAQDKPARLTITAYGGLFENVLRETIIADFTARTGIQVDVALGSPVQWLNQIEASPAQPPFDVVVGSVNLVLVAIRKGLFEPFSVDRISNLADIPQRFTDMCDGHGTVFDYGTSGISYDSNRVANPPSSLKEFIERTAAGEWVASVPSINEPTGHANFIWSLNDVLGGSIDDITPVLEAVKRMRPNLVFWTGMTDFLLHLRSGEADIGLYVDSRTWAENAAGATNFRFINPSEGGIMAPVAVLKPKNSNPWAWELINTMLAPEQQSAFSARTFFGVTNSKAVIPASVIEKITPWEKTRLPPLEQIGPRIPQWVERWNREIGA